MSAIVRVVHSSKRFGLTRVQVASLPDLELTRVAVDKVVGAVQASRPASSDTVASFMAASPFPMACRELTRAEVYKPMGMPNTKLRTGLSK